MEKKIFDVAVIGAVVVGVSIFNDLARNGYNVALIEKELDVSTGTTKANSGIIHAGFDCKPGTLKAKLNVEGNRMFPDICNRLHVPLVRCGAYVIGNDEKVVNDLLSRAKANGVVAEKLNRKQLVTKLPNITENVTCGLFAPNSYIIEPYFYTICLCEEGVVNGGKVFFDYNLKKVNRAENVFTLTDGKTIIEARYIVNCAGGLFNEVSTILQAEHYDIKYRRGEYYVLDHSEKDVVPATVFPLPSSAGKGVLVTPTASGNILVGPTSYESDNSTITTDDGLKEISSKVAGMLNNINLGKTIRIFSGVRSIVGDDFVIEQSKKVDGVVNVAGICSPGLSSAPAISKYVINMLGLNYSNTSHAKTITPYTKLSELSVEERNRLIKKNSDYGKIVCKCENITLGEIKDAINRPIRPTTLDGIKRRVRPGMGRCQGGFCNDKVALILAKENGRTIDDIVKEKKAGKYVVGDVASKGVDR